MPVKRTALGLAVLVVVQFASAPTALAHGIAGNRYFDGTLTFDDPAVADEAILPLYQNLSYPAQGSNVDENRINWAFARLLTPTLAFTADGGWMHQNWPLAIRQGSTRLTSASNTRPIATTSMKRWSPSASTGALPIRARAQSGPTCRTRFNRAFSSARDLAISLMRCPGCVPSRSQAPSWTRFRSAPAAWRWRRTFQWAGSIPSSSPQSKRCIGVSRSSTLRSI